MDFDSYYSIDSIIADNQKVPSEFLTDVPSLGWLQGGLDKDIKEGSKVDLPYWMSSTLALSEYDFLNLSIPGAFSGRVSNALLASPTYVKLANLNHFWYSFGLRISDLLEDNAKLQQSLRVAFSQRLIEIFDLGQYEGNVEDKSFESEFKAGMDELEKQLLEHCSRSAAKHKRL
ncbi:GINS complex, Psf3 component [Wallemia mellicola]|uniref:DNA replication complex GINS protein PSF3 n=1 Tax=Wallemia mellicola TaxID=1708541 RepID=A0AB74KGI3_9BASI|nr:GINS complex, Psf3 component [Wallemia mellicola]TIC68610.1 GINS complex, Psf3 component [Wallemia mellicola]